MMKRLTKNDYKRAAKAIGCEPAVVKAVVAVESSGSGFLNNGKPKILFEAHYFSRFTKGKYNNSHPKISSPKWNRKLYVGGKGEYTRLNQAIKLDKTAALKSASYGLFQIMGFNFKVSGYTNVEGFVKAMNMSEGTQLDAFIGFVKGNKLAKHMVNKNWSGFARGYNGPGYKKNKYHIKLANAYKKYKGSSAKTVTNKAKTTPKSSAVNPQDSYVIKSGDTLSKVSKNFFQGSLKQLLRINPQITNPNKIRVGQVVRLA